MKRYLVTGAAGSIGVHVVNQILGQTDSEVVALDSFRHKGYRDRLERLYKENEGWRPRVRELEHDLICPINKEVTDFIGPIDYIIHLAALSDVFLSIENPVYTVQNNIISTLNILEYARTVKPEVFIYFSTDEVYGPVGWELCQNFPICQDGSPENHKHLGAHKEWDTHKPSNAYAASKAASEDICYAYWRSYNVPLIITNTMNNFGEMQSASKFPVIIQKKLANGEKITIHGNEKEIGSRYYIHSGVVADALLYITEKGAKLHTQGEIDNPYRYHIVGEKALDNLELARLIAKLMSKEIDYEVIDFHASNPAHDIHYGLANNNLKEIGWKYPMSMEACLENTIKWQESNPEWIR